MFVDTIIKFYNCKVGKWTSPRGEEKQFKAAEFTLKWHGQKKGKLVIMKDNKEKILQNALESCAHTDGVENHHEIIETATHVVGAIELEHQQLSQQTKHSNVPVSTICENCEDYKRNITNILSMLNELQTKQREESQQNTSRSTEFENTMRTLGEQNIKMAAEIDSLKSTVSELSSENMSIKCILDMKQSEWTEVKGKKTEKEPKTSSRSTNSRTLITDNHFEVLDVEESIPGNDNLKTKHEKYSVVTNRKTGQRKDHRVISDSSQPKSSRSERSTSKTKKPPTKKPDQQKPVLVIGDSMVKHIDPSKIGRAARNKAISHSYSGATVNQIAQKFKDHPSEEKEFSHIILHVGTNDLVREDPESVAANMEALIKKAKMHTEKIAVSGATKRYDGKVTNNKIQQYNNLVHSLCSKQKLTFIDNSCIDKPLLNRSNLHLNREGDKALGSAFCSYLKSDRIRMTNMASNHKKNSQFFRPTHGRQEDWTLYLTRVKQLMKQKVD